MSFEVKVPAVGESVQEGQIYKWHKKSGDYVNRDDVMVELETDKATVEIVAETSGVITTLVKEGDTVAVGDKIATIDTSAPMPASAPAKSAPPPPPQPTPQADKALATADKPLSPAVSRLVNEQNLDPKQISGSGRDGRITKTDVVQHLAAAPGKSTSAAPEIARTLNVMTGARETRRVKMSKLRQTIAERLVQAQQTAAMLTTFNEIDMTAVMDMRKRYKDSFKDHHGVNLGFMSFFVKAVVEALKTYPAINGFVDGTDIVYHDYCDIGVAVSTERGLMVPVLRNCESLSFAGVEQAIGEYAKKGRDGKITLDDLAGGTFTISNGGTFGSLLSTPILNPPQSGILGMHKIEERPIAINGQVVIRPMMYVALSYDHRIVDGKEAVGFLVKVKECIEDPARLLLGV